MHTSKRYSGKNFNFHNHVTILFKICCQFLIHHDFLQEYFLKISFARARSINIFLSIQNLKNSFVRKISCLNDRLIFKIVEILRVLTIFV